MERNREHDQMPNAYEADTEKGNAVSENFKYSCTQLFAWPLSCNLVEVIRLPSYQSSRDRDKQQPGRHISPGSIQRWYQMILELQQQCAKRGFELSETLVALVVSTRN
uniref:Uncharacterized protein n=1 Tax=Tetraodon nigroviridis TaxID=99883 RepID=H3BZP4_TETNG